MRAERIRVATKEMDEEVVVISNITKIFRKFLHKKSAVDRLSVGIKKGEVI